MTALTSIVESAGHIATPLEGQGSWVREDGGAADMRNAGDYPIFTRCKGCSRRITLAGILQMEWRHVPAKVAP
jgi:hypothetical protein